MHVVPTLDAFHQGEQPCMFGQTVVLEAGVAVVPLTGLEKVRNEDKMLKI